jgi:NAD(P)-dependent dehydrogenase (short-subunit alcohol dehydrogenase family)
MTNSNIPFSKFDLTNRLALITGAAGLLGVQHSQALLEAGSDVILQDVDDEKLDWTQKSLSEMYPSKVILKSNSDITSEKSMYALQKKLESEQRTVSILINNAAINPKYEDITNNSSGSRLENFDLKDWESQLRVGLTGAFICSKIFGSVMAKNRSGVIVNIASDLSIISPDQRLYEVKDLNPSEQPVKPITYSVIKSGLIGLTKYLATYWRDAGVRVNALSPGGVYDGQSPEFLERLSHLVPLGRMANADEYREAIQFLSSDASSYMTGQNLVIDGGRTIW